MQSSLSASPAPSLTNTIQSEIKETPFEKLKKLHLACKGKSGKGKVPVIFDTDLGHDPDDIKVFICNLINDPNIDCKAVVTTGEFADVKARIAKAILHQMGRADIKIYVGKGLHLSDIKLPTGKSPTTIDEAMQGLSEKEQMEYLEKYQPTYPGEKSNSKDISFGGFYTFQGKAWEEFGIYQEKMAPDGDIKDATALLKKITSEFPLKDQPKALVISTGELSNIAYYYENGLAPDIIVQSMSGWSGKNNTSGCAEIFPRLFLGRNLVADIEAAETVFKQKDANIILYMSHLKKQYGLELNSDIRKLLCLVDKAPIDQLSDEKLRNLLGTLLCDLNDIDDLSNVKAKKLNLQTLEIQEVKKYLKDLIPTAGVAEMPYATPLGKAMARDFAHWLCFTAFPYIIASDPATFITAIHPEQVTSVQAVDVTVDAGLAKKQNEKFMRSFFENSVKTEDGDNISAINGLKANGKEIMQMIISGLLAQKYPGVTYKQFMEIANDKTKKLVDKGKLLNEIASKFAKKDEKTVSTVVDLSREANVGGCTLMFFSKKDDVKEEIVAKKTAAAKL